MAEVVCIPAQVGLVDPMKAVVRSYRAAVAITSGRAVYLLADGRVGLAAADQAGRDQFRGIALQTVGAGQVVDVVEQGDVWGFNVAAINCDAFVFLGDRDAGPPVRDGLLDDAASAGGTTVRVGRVVALTDQAATRVLRVFTQWLANWV